MSKLVQLKKNIYHITFFKKIRYNPNNDLSTKNSYSERRAWTSLLRYQCQTDFGKSQTASRYFIQTSLIPCLTDISEHWIMFTSHLHPCKGIVKEALVEPLHTYKLNQCDARKQFEKRTINWLMVYFCVIHAIPRVIL